MHGACCVKKTMLGNPKLAFNWDGGSPAVMCVGATGGYGIRIVLRGIASHAGGAPQWGISAIAIVALAIADLQRGGWHGAIEKGRQRGTSNVGFIKADELGSTSNQVADEMAMMQRKAA